MRHRRYRARDYSTRPRLREFPTAHFRFHEDRATRPDWFSPLDFWFVRPPAGAAVRGWAGIGTAAKLIGREGPTPLESFAKVITVNLIGTINALRLTAGAMVGNAPDEGGERGVCVNTASVAAYDGQIGQVAYAASKGGVVSLTLPVARELAGKGVRVVTIAPGLFDTPMMATLPWSDRRDHVEPPRAPERLDGRDGRGLSRAARGRRRGP